MDNSGLFIRRIDMKTNLDKLVFRFTGVMILLSLLLSQLHSLYWLWFTTFIGANMFQASFTGFCPLAKLLSLTGAPPGIAFTCRQGADTK